MSQGHSEKNTQSIHDFIKNNKLEEIKILVEKNRDLVHYTTDKGVSPLIDAVRLGRYDIVQYLVEQGANLSDRYIGMQPLHWAVCSSKIDIAKFLIQSGAPIHSESTIDNQVDPEAVDARPLICLAAGMREGIQIIKALLEKDPSLINETYLNETPLAIAKNFGRKETVKFLLDRGADPLDLLSHSNILLFLKALGYEINEKGHCQGIINTIFQSMCIANGVKSATECLEKINNIIRDSEEEVMSVRGIIKNKKIYKSHLMYCISAKVDALKPAEKYDLIPFCEGFSLLQEKNLSLSKEEDTFHIKKDLKWRILRGLGMLPKQSLFDDANRYRKIKLLEKYASLLLPKEEEGLKNLVYWEGNYDTATELPRLFEGLREILNQPGFPHPVIVRFSSFGNKTGHTTGVGYDPDKKTWILIESNALSSLKRSFDTDIKIARAVEDALVRYKEGNTLKLICSLQLPSSKHAKALPYINEWMNHSWAHKEKQKEIRSNLFFNVFVVCVQFMIASATILMLPSSIPTILSVLIGIGSTLLSGPLFLKLKKLMIQPEQKISKLSEGNTYQDVSTDLKNQDQEERGCQKTEINTLSPLPVKLDIKSIFFQKNEQLNNLPDDEYIKPSNPQSRI